MTSKREGRVCRHKGDRGECLAPDCNCPRREPAEVPDLMADLKASRGIQPREGTTHD